MCQSDITLIIAVQQVGYLDIAIVTNKQILRLEVWRAASVACTCEHPHRHCTSLYALGLACTMALHTCGSLTAVNKIALV
jgi:hypothetical protein